MQVVHDAAGIIALLVARHATAAKGVNQAAVPARRRIPGRQLPRRRWSRRIREISDLIDRAVDRPRLEANDVGHTLAVDRGHFQVGRARARDWQGLERRSASALRRHRGFVHPGHLGRGRTVLVERRAEVPDFCLTHERFLVRARENRSGDRVVGQLEGGFDRARLDLDRAPPQGKVGEQRRCAVWKRPAPVLLQRCRSSVDGDGVLRPGTGASDTQERIAAGHHVGAPRQNADRQRRDRSWGRLSCQRHPGHGKRREYQYCQGRHCQGRRQARHPFDHETLRGWILQAKWPSGVADRLHALTDLGQHGRIVNRRRQRVLHAVREAFHRAA